MIYRNKGEKEMRNWYSGEEKQKVWKTKINEGHFGGTSKWSPLFKSYEETQEADCFNQKREKEDLKGGTIRGSSFYLNAC